MELDADTGPEIPTATSELWSSATYRLSESPAHLLRRAQQLYNEIYLTTGRTDGVTQRQSIVLAAVAENEGLSQSDLVTATGIDRSTLADMVQRMEQKSLIARSESPEDGRAKSVRLTDDGRQALSLALPALERVDESILAFLPRNRRKAFIDLLSLLSAAADERGLTEIDGKEKTKKKKNKGQKKKTGSKKKSVKKARS